MWKGRRPGIVCVFITELEVTDAFLSSVNIPWSEAGMGDADYLYVFHNIVMPIAMEYAPELVFSKTLSISARVLSDAPTVSAGFDAADGDDLGECHVTPAGYAHMTNMLCSLASGQVVVALEVFGVSHLLEIYPRDRSIGGLQPRIHLKFDIGCNEGPTG